ncbi:glycosyltransferase family 9 protein [Rhodanobacter sp. T12-5]|uniref:glycosyltransferase family 9 protein n=1 Tax=Rhodanobacter sp. T12-5 TaxID=2024611 RepID=UPI001562E35A|nr:glycosyltransferase family 9 protein [Rhodanobacter sp. T12-5]
MQVLADARGTVWKTTSRQAFKGPRHGQHVRDSMAQAAGVEEDGLAVSIARSTPPVAMHRPRVIVCPDAGARYKEWHRSRWAPLSEHLLSLGCEVIVCGMPGRQQVPLPQHTRRADMTAPALASAMLGALAVIGPDSGHVHLADALGIPAVGLYAATSTVTYGPYRDRRWCIDRHQAAFSSGATYDSAKHLPGHAMDLISVDDVLGVLSGLLRIPRR